MNKSWFLFLLGLIIPSLAGAHGRWIVPSHTVVSGTEPTSIAVDMSISNDVFHPDNPYGGLPLASIGTAKAEEKKSNASEHPLAKIARSTRLEVVNPQTHKISHQPIVNLGRKSASSVPLEHNGTYRLEVTQDPIFFTSFSTENQQHGRVFGIGKHADAQLPKGATHIEGVKLVNRVQTFVTRNNSTQQAIEPADKGLSLRFHHHPNDLFANESLKVNVMFDGKPQPGAEVKITKGQTRYRNDRQTIKLVTDKNGAAIIQWQGPGMYIIECERVQTVNGEAYNRQVNALYVTLEVFPE